jgi:hypothetical protein
LRIQSTIWVVCLSREAFDRLSRLRNFMYDTSLDFDTRRWSHVGDLRHYAMVLTHAGLMNFRFRTPPNDEFDSNMIILPSGDWLTPDRFYYDGGRVTRALDE